MLCLNVRLQKPLTPQANFQSPAAPADTLGTIAQIRARETTERHLTFDADDERLPSLPPRHDNTANMATSAQSVQCFGKKKTATAVAHCKSGKGLIKVNGKPLSLVEPQILRFKVYEPVLILGLDKFGMS